MKKAATAILSFAIFISAAVPSFAAKAETPTERSRTVETQVVLRAEQTKWYYRKNPQTGRPEKRQWSVTYAQWLTDWIPAF